MVQIITTVSKKQDARQIGECVLRSHLAACVQIIGPIESMYRWKRKAERDREWPCVMKTKKTLRARLQGEIERIHPYETPEILTLPVLAANEDYLAWLGGEVKRR